MNKIIESLEGDRNHHKLVLVMNDDKEFQQFAKAVPVVTPGTHYQCVQWEERGGGKLRALCLYPAVHPCGVVAAVTENFTKLDEKQLKWLCEREGIDTTEAYKETTPEKLHDALCKLLQAKFPPTEAPPASVNNRGGAEVVREKVIILDKDVAAMSLETLEKTAQQLSGINEFKAMQKRKATIAELQAFVCRLRARDKENKRKEREGHVEVLQRA